MKKVSEDEYDRLAKGVASGKIGIGSLPKKRQRTFYVLTKVLVKDGTVEIQDITPWLFSTFRKANKAMYDDYCVEYGDRDGKNTAHPESIAPFESDTHAWCQFNDGELEILWNISKCKVDGATVFSPDGPKRRYVKDDNDHH